MLGVAIAMAIATMPAQTVVISLFNESFRSALDINVTELSLAYTLGTIAAAFPLPFVGRMADRFGLRIVTAIISCACAGALALTSFAGSLVALGICFFLVRFLGQGALGLLAGHTIAMWFERRLGFAHSMLAVVGFAGGSALLPAPTAWLITTYGWRSTLFILAAGVLALTIPSLLFLFRNKPEDVGQFLDGDPAPHASHDVLHGGRPPATDPAFTLREALATRAFWIIVPIMCSAGLIGTALLFHMQTMLQCAGLAGTEQQAALGIQAWPISFGVGMIAVGYLVDRILPRKLMPFAPVLMLIACLICLLGASGWVTERYGERWTLFTIGAGMGVFGLSMAISAAVGNPTIARYFGRTHHGAIRGAIQLASVAATGMGPFLAGYAYELAGRSFTPILAIFAASGVPLIVASLFLRPPAPPIDRDLSHPDPDEPDPVIT